MPAKSIEFTKKAVASMRGNPFVNVVTIGVIALSFLILGSFLILFGNLKSLLSVWEQGVQVELYLKDGLASDHVKALQDSIVSLDGVKEVKYISKDDAVKRLNDEMPAISGLLDDLDENPLPSSIMVVLAEDYRGVEKVESLASDLMKRPGVDDVHYGQEWLEKFSGLLYLVKLSGLIMALFLLLTTTFIISNTIRLALYARKEELEIMKLLGATDSFIKLPFYIEGLLQGLVGAAAAIVSLYALYNIFANSLSSAKGLSLLSLSTGSFQLSFLPLETTFYLLFCGMALGLFGSFLSLGRFLKV